MTDDQRKATAERRQADRRPLQGEVTVRFELTELVGPGQNISETGVFFVVDRAIPVMVEVEGRDEPRRGELVRVQSMGQDGTGIAIRFLP